MDKLKKYTDFLGKYKYFVLVLLLGVALMLLPGKQAAQTQESAPTEPEETVSDAESIEQILAQVDGVGQVKVLLTVAEGERFVYQTDDGTTTVTLTDADRAEAGLLQQILPQQYRGAIVVCQGGDDPLVRLQIVQAVANLTGLTSDKITVLKMK